MIAKRSGRLQEQATQGRSDGLLGPLPREALTPYQSDNGLLHHRSDRRADARVAWDDWIEPASLHRKVAGFKRPAAFSVSGSACLPACVGRLGGGDQRPRRSTVYSPQGYDFQASTHRSFRKPQSVNPRFVHPSFYFSSAFGFIIPLADQMPAALLSACGTTLNLDGLLLDAALKATEEQRRPNHSSRP